VDKDLYIGVKFVLSVVLSAV